MATIEDKIKLFSKIVNERMQQEKQKELDEFELQRKDTIEWKKHELEDIRKTVIQEATKKVQLRCNEIISRDKLEIQSAVLEIKKAFINETIDELRARLTAFTKSNEYKDFLIVLTEKTVKDIEKGDYIISMSENDRSKYGKVLETKLNGYKGRNFTMEVTDEDIIGGIVLQNKSGRFRVNAGLASKLEDCTDYVGVKISEKIG